MSRNFRRIDGAPSTSCTSSAVKRTEVTKPTNWVAVKRTRAYADFLADSITPGARSCGRDALVPHVYRQTVLLPLDRAPDKGLTTFRRRIEVDYLAFVSQP